jgi:predicted exporter
LVSQDRAVRQAAGTLDPSRFVLIQGKSEEELLQRQEVVHERLSALVTQGLLDSFQGLAPFLPSEGRRRADKLLLRSVLLPWEPQLRAHLDIFPRLVWDEIFQDLRSPALVPFSLDEWLASPVSEGLRHLWLGKTKGGSPPGGFLSLVLLGNGANVFTALKDIPGVRAHDRLKEYTDLIRRYRQRAMILVGAAYGVIFLLMVVRYGAAAGVAVTLPCLLSGVLTTLVLPGAFNLMHILGLVLVLGMAVDYSIFFAESAHQGTGVQAAGLGIALSTATTALSFGFLAFSASPALAALGRSVSVGMVFALLLAPMPFMVMEKQTHG